MTGFFKPSREDGRSDGQVVFDLAREAPANTTFEYPVLLATLLEGLTTDRKITRKHVYKAIAGANKLLLVQQQRYLSVVKDVGYRILAADEHSDVALSRYRRGHAEVKRGMTILQNVRWDEMEPESRKVHEGTMLVLSGVAQAFQVMARDVSVHQQLIDGLLEGQQQIVERIAKIETRGVGEET